MFDELEMREVTFHFPSLVRDFEPAQIAFSVKRLVHVGSQIQAEALEALRSEMSDQNIYADHFPEEMFPSWFGVHLLRSGISPSEYTGPQDDIPIAFGVAPNGLNDYVYFNLDPQSSYPYNTFEGLETLASWGLVKGQREHFVIRLTYGRGGDGYFTDLVGWLFDQGVDVAKDLVVDIVIIRLVTPFFKFLRNKKRDRKARRIAVYWAARGLFAPVQLREFIDFKDEWTTKEVAKRLKISEEGSRELLKALGFEINTRGVWSPGRSKRARRRRRKWEASESEVFLEPPENDK